METVTSTSLYRDVPETLDANVDLVAPPNEEDAEQAVIGAIITDNDQYDAVSNIIQAKDFYSPRHQIIYRSMEHLFDSKQSVDLVTMKEYLDRIGKLNEVGGIKYLARIQQNTPQTLNATSYARIVQDKSILRNLLRCANTIQKMVF